MVKRLVAFVFENAVKECELVLVVEVEVVSIENEEDQGFFDPGVEVYRTPFPCNPKIRKQFLRSCIKEPKFFMS